MFKQSQIKNPTRSLKEVVKADNRVTTKGHVLMYTSGLAVPGTSSTTVANLIGICNEAITAEQALTQVPVIEVFQNDVWLADSTNNSNAAHTGQKMVLGANAGVVNNSGTTDADGVVQQVGVYGAAADRKILVRFLTA